ncbi:MAG: nuclear transport factor 2 family protein [Bacteroidota bacterium]
MEKLIHEFYAAFTRRDAEKMAACYHEEIVFHDPAFGELQGEEVSMMWRMLCAQGKDLYIEFSNIKANEQNGSAHWEATYTFSQTGRKVHNVIEASFVFKDGKIVRHIDRFSLHKWARQAIGWKGLLMGGTKFFQKRLQKQTRKALDRYIAKAS